MVRKVYYYYYYSYHYMYINRGLLIIAILLLFMANSGHHSARTTWNHYGKTLIRTLLWELWVKLRDLVGNKKDPIAGKLENLKMFGFSMGTSTLFAIPMTLTPASCCEKQGAT